MKIRHLSSVFMMLTLSFVWFAGCSGGEPVPVAPGPGSEVTPTPLRTVSPTPRLTPIVRPTYFYR